MVVKKCCCRRQAKCCQPCCPVPRPICPPPQIVFPPPAPLPPPPPQPHHEHSHRPQIVNIGPQPGPCCDPPLVPPELFQMLMHIKGGDATIIKNTTGAINPNNANNPNSCNANCLGVGNTVPGGPAIQPPGSLFQYTNNPGGGLF